MLITESEPALSFENPDFLRGLAVPPLSAEPETFTLQPAGDPDTDLTDLPDAGLAPAADSVISAVLPMPEAGAVEAGAVQANMAAIPSLTTAIRPAPFLKGNDTLWRDVLEAFIVIVAIYTLVNLATARAIVEGASMQPNFATGQLIIVNRLSYFFSTPQRGDVVVLHSPTDGSEDLIKRVIGLPWDTVEIRDGMVYVNGRQLAEPYILDENRCTVACDGVWALNADQYFVLGDNRASSYDGHSFGPIKRSLIVGQAWLRYWPPPNFGFIPHERYNDNGPLLPAPTATPAPPLRRPPPQRGPSSA